MASTVRRRSASATSSGRARSGRRASGSRRLRRPARSQPVVERTRRAMNLEPHPMTGPTFTDVLRARRVIDAHLPRTPLHHYPTLDRLLQAEVYVKHENYQPIGAFK